MLCKDNMANLDYKSNIYNTKHIFPSFFFFKGIIKITSHEMHECYAMQILKSQKKIKQQKKNGHKEYWNEAQGP